MLLQSVTVLYITASCQLYIYIYACTVFIVVSVNIACAHVHRARKMPGLLNGPMASGLCLECFLGPHFLPHARGAAPGLQLHPLEPFDGPGLCLEKLSRAPPFLVYILDCYKCIYMHACSFLYLHLDRFFFCRHLDRYSFYYRFGTGIKFSVHYPH